MSKGKKPILPDHTHGLQVASVQSQVLLTICLWCILGFMCNPALGQSDSLRKNNLDISMGSFHYRWIDEAFSFDRFKFSGNSFILSLNYGRKIKRNLLKSTFAGCLGQATSAQGFKADLYFFQWTSGFLFRTKFQEFLGKTCVLYLGPQLSIKDYAFVNRDIIENSAVLLNNTVNLEVLTIWPLGEKQRLKFNLTLPTLGWVRREHSDGGANAELESSYEKGVFNMLFTGYQFRLIPPWQLLGLKLSYLINIGEQVALSVDYYFDYTANDDLLPMQLYGNSLLLGLNFDF